MRASAVLAGGLLLSLAAAAYFGLQWRSAESRAAKATESGSFLADSLGSAMGFPPPPVGPEGRDSVYWQSVATTAALQARRWQQAVRLAAEGRATLLETHEIEELRRRGLEDPVANLRADLVAHRELIPFDGVLGGTMRFSGEDRIVLLTPPYVFAQFDDGHIQGSMLLEYSLSPGGVIVWEELWTALD